MSGEAQIGRVRIGPVLRRGKGEARDERGGLVSVPFTLPGELVEASATDREDCDLLRVLEPSDGRVEPGCPHFGVCGGCQLQMGSTAEQLRIKEAVLLDKLAAAGVGELPGVQVHAAEPWGYRNRIRLRVGRDAMGARRVGYNERASRRFLPISTCPISAPLLWRAAEALLACAESSPEMRAWMDSAAEVELFADESLGKLQVLLLVEGSAPAKADVVFARAMTALQMGVPELTGAGAVMLGPQPQNGQSGGRDRDRGIRERTRTPVTSWGAAGLTYTVEAERYWVTRGGFFQVNRFLLPELVRVVCEGRAGAGRKGESAWDLFAGVGLFSRVLAQRFARVTAVEGNPIAAKDLQSALAKIGKDHRTVQASTLELLRDAVVQRERPDLLVLDPPRAGAGEEAGELLLRLGVPEMVYVSCDPETLARDLAVLRRGYRIAALHLFDLFPQTYHQETVAILERQP